MDAKTKFKVNFFFHVLDVSVNSLKERFLQLENHNFYFDFLYNFTNISDMPKNELINKCQNLEKILTEKDHKDVDWKEMVDELDVLGSITFVKENPSPLEVLKYISKNDFFPNVSIALRILLTLPISVATAERSFSKLKLIKNYLRSTMAQERLSDLATISIEHKVGEHLDHEDLIKDFASIKSRKVNFK